MFKDKKVYLVNARVDSRCGINSV